VADIINYETDFMKNYAKKIKQAADLINEAYKSLQHAFNHSTWRCPERVHIASEVAETKDGVSKMRDALRNLADALDKGADRFEAWDRALSARNIELAAPLLDYWGFESDVWEPGPAAATGGSSSTQTVGGSVSWPSQSAAGGSSGSAGSGTLKLPTINIPAIKFPSLTFPSIGGTPKVTVEPLAKIVVGGSDSIDLNPISEGISNSVVSGGEFVLDFVNVLGKMMGKILGTNT
jgi:uncharacterized protein YukE